MVIGRQLTAQERRRSQRLYCAFNFGNGLSYVCLAESVLVLFAAQLGAPNAVVALLGAMQFAGYAMLPLGIRRTAQRGAAVCQADFWVARNVAALLTAAAGAVWLVSPAASWATLLVGSFLFYGFRAAGCVLFTPLLGDVSTEEEAPAVIGDTTAFFNISGVAALAVITAVTRRWHGREALAAIIVVGAALGMASSFFLRGMKETGAVRDAARAPFRGTVSAAFRESPGLLPLSAVWFLLNLALIMLIPMSVLALKRGCGFGDSAALTCACAQFSAGIAASFACGPLCRRFGAFRMLSLSALGIAAVPLAWLAFPEAAASGRPALWAGLAMFFLLGTLYYFVYNAANSAFLEVCPDKKNQVAGSIAVNLVSGAGAGVVASILGAWLATRAPDWAAASGLSILAGPLGPFRLYFLLLLPVLCLTAAFSTPPRRR